MHNGSASFNFKFKFWEKMDKLKKVERKKKRPKKNIRKNKVKKV